MNEQFPGLDAGSPVDHTDLCTFADLHELIVMENQMAFQEWLGEDSRKNFTVNPQDGTLSLGDRTLAAQLLGSLSFLDNTWLWSWANPGYRGNPMTEAAIWLRDSSPVHDRVWQLRTAKFPLDGRSSQDGAPAWAVQFSAFAWLAPRAQYSCDYGPGRAFLTIHDEAVPRFQPSPTRFPQLVATRIRQGRATSSAVSAYAQWHGLQFAQFAPEQWRIVFGDGTAYTTQTDEYGRATRLQGPRA